MNGYAFKYKEVWLQINIRVWICIPYTDLVKVQVHMCICVLIYINNGKHISPGGERVEISCGVRGVSWLRLTYTRTSLITNKAVSLPTVIVYKCGMAGIAAAEQP